MQLWLMTQSVNTDYDTYGAAVVAAETEEDAREIHPDRSNRPSVDWKEWDGWVMDKSHIVCTLIGIATPGTKRGVICASYHAG